MTTMKLEARGAGGAGCAQQGHDLTDVSRAGRQVGAAHGRRARAAARGAADGAGG